MSGTFHLLGRLESCRAVRQGGTRRSGVSGRCGWSRRSCVARHRVGRHAGGVGVSRIGTGGAVRKWVRQAEIDDGSRPGVSTEGSAELKRLKRENAELSKTVC